MKTKFVATIVALTMSTTLMGQAAEGGYFAGGSFNFSISSSSSTSGNTTIDGPTTTRFGINPIAGMFLDDNLAIGAGVGFNLNSQKTPMGDNDVTVTQTVFSLSPFARYYMGAENVGLYAEAGIGVGFGGSSVKSGNTTTDGPSIFNFDIGVVPGVYYYIAPGLSLEARFGFLGLERSQQKDDNDDKEVQTDFGLTLNPSSLSFGMTYHF